jgi:ADP-ribose pyrophosphatase YjhB (NUDIX family)
MQRLRRMLEPIIRPLIRCHLRISHSKTLGVRAIVIDETDRVFLVKHSYVSGWYLPGGGVEIGESALSALVRELAEEGNIQLTGVPRLHGIFLNKRTSQRDYIVLFVVREFRQDEPPLPNREIVAHGFFSRDALPEETSRATRARIVEVFNSQTVSELW